MSRNQQPIQKGVDDSKDTTQAPQTPEATYRSVDSVPLTTESVGIGRAVFIDKDSKVPYSKRFDTICKLGHGSFGKVYLVREKSSSIQKVCKEVKKKGLRPVELTSIRTEIEALKKLDHPNIVRLYEYEEDDDFFYLIMEVLKGGDCSALIKKNQHGVEENVAAKLVKDLLVGIAYSHSFGVVHRDIKPGNLMLTSKDLDVPKAKIIDFGLSTLFKHGEARVIHRRAGTIHFMAPEVLNQKPYGDSADIWSIGITTYFLLYGRVPFYGKNMADMKQFLRECKVRFPRPGTIPPRSREARDFIRSLLQQNPDDRFTAAQALHHPWILKQCQLPEICPENLASNWTVSRVGLRNYAECPYFVKACVLLMATELSHTEIEAIENLFESFDKKQDGFIAKKDMKQILLETSVLTRTKTGESDVEQAIQMADLNNNGVIDFSEFVACVLYSKLFSEDDNSPTKTNLAQYAFSFFDQDKDGVITAKNIRDCIQTPAVQEIESKLQVDYCDWLQIFPDAHTFDFEAFCRMLTEKRDVIAVGVQMPPTVARDTQRQQTFSDKVRSDRQSMLLDGVNFDQSDSESEDIQTTKRSRCCKLFW